MVKKLAELTEEKKDKDFEGIFRYKYVGPQKSTENDTIWRRVEIIEDKKYNDKE